MPTTRRSSGNRPQESPRPADTRKLPGRSSRKNQHHDVTDNPVTEKFIYCKGCSGCLGEDCLNTKDLDAIKGATNSFWLCEVCYSALPKDDQTRSFLKIPTNGGFFDFEDSAPSVPSMLSPESPETLHHFSSGNVNTTAYNTHFQQPSLKSHDHHLRRNYDLMNLLNKKINYLIVSFIVLSFSIILGVWLVMSPSQGVDKPVAEPVELKIQISFEDLEKTFPQQNEDLWANFVSGFNSIASSDEIAPAVFLVLHSSNPQTSFCIIKKVCNIAHEHLEVASKPFVVDAVQLRDKYSDYGDFILEMQKNMKNTNISVIRNLHKMPGKLAQALHGLTDAYNPSLQKVIYVLSIPVNNSAQSESVFEYAEDILHENWKDVKEETLDPLIARLTNNVVWIEDETKFPDYC